MFKIDNATSVAVKPPVSAAGVAGYFTDGDPAAGEAATILPAEWLNNLQDELINVLVAAGIAPDKTATNQIAAAVGVIAAGVTAGVTSFNTRTGAITLTNTDVINALTYTPANKAGDTLTGKFNFLAASGGGAGMNIGQGSDPAAPSNGDFWITASGVFARVAGSTIQLASTGSVGVTSFNTRTGAITLTLSDVTTALGYTPVNKAGDTLTGELVLQTTAAGAKPLNMPAGVADLASPAQGDIWNNSDALKYRAASGTKTIAFLDSTLSGNTTGSAAKWTTPRTLTLGNDLSGSVTFDGSANFTLNATVVPASTSAAGKIQIATTATAKTGTDTAQAIVSSALSAVVQSGVQISVADTSGAANTITVTLAPDPGGPQFGSHCFVTVAHTNTAATNLNLNAHGNKAVHLNGAALTGGELVAGRSYLFFYDGTYWNVMGGGSMSGSIGATGWIKLNNGYIRQWGFYSGGSANPSISFPVTFPNAVLGLQFTPVGTGDDTDLSNRSIRSANVDTSSTSGFSAYCAAEDTTPDTFKADTTVQFYWEAFGN